MFGFESFGSRKKTSPTKTEGVSATPTYGGFIYEDEKDRSLVGDEKYKTFSNILANSSITAASIRLFLNLTSKVGWIWEPADNSDEAKRIAELVESIIDDMDTPWARCVRRSAMYRFYGFSIQEWTAKRRDDGVIGLADIAPRAQSTISRWDMEPSGKVLGVEQVSPHDQSSIYLPRSKIVYAVDDALHDSPQGLGLIRHLVEPIKRLQRYEQLEGFGYESDLRGIPIGRAPLSDLNERVENGELTEAERESYLTPLRTFIKKHIKNPNLGLFLDSKTYISEGENPSPSQIKQFDVELLQGTNPSMAEIAKAIDRCNREVSRVLGTEHLMLGDGQGSEALSRDKSHNFALMVDSTTEELGEVYAADVVKTLGALNGWDPKLLPTPKPASSKYRDVRDITGALKDMAQAGAPVLPVDDAVNDVRDLLGVSIAAIDIELEGAMPRATPPKGGDDKDLEGMDE